MSREGSGEGGRGESRERGTGWAEIGYGNIGWRAVIKGSDEAIGLLSPVL